MKNAAILLALTMGLLAIAPGVRAQAPPPNLLVCARMADPGERLRCYDTQMAAMGAVVATPSPAAPVTPVAPVPPAPGQARPAPPPVEVASATPPPREPTPVEKFGSEDLKHSARPQEKETDKVMVSAITAIKEARPKLFIIVLANGQIWMQEGTQITSFFKVGYEARIEKGLLGGYRMSTAQTGEKNLVRVTRIQ